MGKFKCDMKLNAKNLLRSPQAYTPFTILDGGSAVDKKTQKIVKYYEKTSKRIVEGARRLREEKQELMRELSNATEEMELVKEEREKLRVEVRGMKESLGRIVAVLEEGEVEKAKEALAVLIKKCEEVEAVVGGGDKRMWGCTEKSRNESSEWIGGPKISGEWSSVGDGGEEEDVEEEDDEVEEEKEREEEELEEEEEEEEEREEEEENEREEEEEREKEEVKEELETESEVEGEGRTRRERSNDPPKYSASGCALKRCHSEVKLDDADSYEDVRFGKLILDETGVEECMSLALQCPTPPPTSPIPPHLTDASPPTRAEPATTAPSTADVADADADADAAAAPVPQFVPTPQLCPSISQGHESRNRLTRAHNFVAISSLRMGLCSCCGKRFNVGRPTLSCKVCKIVVHGHCQLQLKQHCVPPDNLPRALAFRSRSMDFISPLRPVSSGRSRSRSPSPNAIRLRVIAPKHRSEWHSLSLSALCPANESPCIPAAIILCVNEVESRGLEQPHIYRARVSERRVDGLLEKFLHSSTTPSLALVEDIHVIGSCLRAFLRLLNEPLITYTLRPHFVAAGEANERGHHDSARERAAALMKKLPKANRDTLAFLILHLKKVVSTKACQMSHANLAKLFAPTIVGHSCEEPPLSLITAELPSQQATLSLLLALPDAVYNAMLA